MPSSDAAAGTADGHREALIQVDTAEGTGRFFVALAVDPRAQLFLGHGAGGGVDAVDLSELARALPQHGISVVRFEQPWRTAGGRVASRPPRLDIAWNDALLAVLDRRIVLPGIEPTAALFVGGRSAGARVACRTSAEGPVSGRVSGVVACAFPLHPPDRPERSRLSELLAPCVPRLVLQGDRDTFGGADELRTALAAADADPEAGLRGAGRPAGVEVVRMPGADHSMRLRKNGPITPAEVGTLLVHSVLGFVDGVLG